MAIRDIVQAAAGNVGESLYVEDVFNTYVYTGNGSAQTIPNGIGLGSAYGGSVYIPGSSGLTGTNSGALDYGSSNFTVELWLRADNTGGGTGFLAVPAASSNYSPVLLYSPDGTSLVFFSSSSGSSWNVASAASLGSVPLNSLTHIAIVRNGNTIYLYNNGTQTATVSFSGSFSTSSVFNLFYIGGTPGNAAITGFISNLRVVIGTAVYTSNFTPPTEPLTAISGTALLTCQAPSATTDYSPNALAITANDAIAQNGGGPFTDATLAYGGLVWCKDRTVANSNNLFDTVRGVNYRLISDATNASQQVTGTVTSFNSNGFSVGNSGGSTNRLNGALAAWTFRKAEKFFDIVTYTGNGSTQAISHNLGTTPGFVIIKCTSAGTNWVTWHRELSYGYVMFLNTTAAQDGPFANIFGNNSSVISPEESSTTITVGNSTLVNSNGETYIMYLFAHNAGGFGDAGDKNVITCGGYTGSGAAGNAQTLGWEPQWLLVKRKTGGTGNWLIYDDMRGMAVNSTVTKALVPNASSVEANQTGPYPTATGFAMGSSTSNASGSDYIYIAIRRGLMKVPELGTTVFSPQTSSAATGTPITTNIPIDAQVVHYRAGADSVFWIDRMRGVNSPTTGAATPYLLSNNTNAESSTTGLSNSWSNIGFNIPTGFSGASYVYWNFRRAADFFDVVCYTGNFVAGATQPHNLTVVPEMFIVKARNDVRHWIVYHAALGPTKFIELSTTAAAQTNSSYWNDTAPTSTVFSLGQAFAVNYTSNYVAYLFASAPGVSKVGSYTGTGTTQQINCGFTTGARFVMIKRTDDVGNWYVWDSARGIVAGNDPYVWMDSNAAEVTNTDYIDTYSAGFEITSTAPAEINANGGSYIFLAIA